MQKSGNIVLKGLHWVHNDKIESNGLEKHELGTQCKNIPIFCASS